MTTHRSQGSSQAWCIVVVLARQEISMILVFRVWLLAGFCFTICLYSHHCSSGPSNDSRVDIHTSKACVRHTSSSILRKKRQDANWGYDREVPKSMTYNSIEIAPKNVISLWVGKPRKCLGAEIKFPWRWNNLLLPSRTITLHKYDTLQEAGLWQLIAFVS